MRKITWVGINHYMTNEQLKAFYRTVKENDVVFFVFEPNNSWDSNAVAVYYGFLMCGHISRYQTEVVHEMHRKGLVLVGRVTGEIDEELNQIELLVDDVSFEETIRHGSRMLGTSAIGMDVDFFRSYEELSYTLVKNFIDAHVAVINQSNLDSESVRQSADAIVRSVETYLTIWNRSMSVEANCMPKYLQEVIDRLRSMDRSMYEAMKDVYRRLKIVVNRQSKTERHLKDLEAQLKGISDYYDMKGGFFETYRETVGDDHDALEARLKAIGNWLSALPMGVGEFWGDDRSHFATKIYCAGFCQEDYYRIMTHIVLYDKIKQWLYGKGEAVKVDMIVVNGDVNFNGEANIVTQIDNEGTVNID